MSDDKSGNASGDPSGASSDKQGFASKMAPVTEQERQITQHAKGEFDKGNYDACIASLGINNIHFAIPGLILSTCAYTKCEPAKRRKVTD